MNPSLDTTAPASSIVPMVPMAILPKSSISSSPFAAPQRLLGGIFRVNPHAHGFFIVRDGHKRRVSRVFERADRAKQVNLLAVRCAERLRDFPRNRYFHFLSGSAPV